jgi:hypothetical protein
VFRKILAFCAAVAAPLCVAQEHSAPQRPQVKVNILNVCSPSSQEQQEIASALAHVSKRPEFSQDFEVDRGRSVLDVSANPLMAAGPAAPANHDSATADFVRIRHDLSGTGTYGTVQYSFSRDNKQMVETLVFRVRDPKELLQLSIDDDASAVTSPGVMLSSTTPASRIKLERFGKSSVVLARCQGLEGSPPVNQSAYEPLFESASAVLLNYRNLLEVKTLVPQELIRIRHGHAQAERQKTVVKHKVN